MEDFHNISLTCILEYLGLVLHEGFALKLSFLFISINSDGAVFRLWSKLPALSMITGLVVFVVEFSKNVPPPPPPNSERRF